jgi:hypothetical protein
MCKVQDSIPSTEKEGRERKGGWEGERKKGKKDLTATEKFM